MNLAELTHEWSKFIVSLAELSDLNHFDIVFTVHHHPIVVPIVNLIFKCLNINKNVKQKWEIIFNKH